MAVRSIAQESVSSVETDPRRWRILAVLSIAELLGMSLWFGASAVAPQLATEWQLSSAQSALLTTLVQFGFVAGTALSAMLNLADVVPSRTLFSIAALIGAAVNAAILAAPSFAVVLLLRFLTGLALAGVYPPAMKMISTWFQARRGLAIGAIVGALTVGKATPYLVHAIPGAGTREVILAATIAAIFGAMLVGLLYSDGPYSFASRPFSWSLAGTVVREQRWRLATGSYLGHMWELYAFWTWIPAYVAASLAARSGNDVTGGGIVSLLAFLAIAVGGAGCVWGGIYADRSGREKLVAIALAASGACCLLSGIVFGAPLLLLAAVTLVWGFFVIADSAQFSALVTESVPSHAVGTALTLQVSLGFLLTMLPIQLLPAIAATAGWRWAFPILAVGPAAGILIITRLARLRRTATPAIAAT
ncbi:MAG TPA: MFS transporter [Gemmatimonadaceae bacterium]